MCQFNRTVTAASRAHGHCLRARWHTVAADRTIVRCDRISSRAMKDVKGESGSSVSLKALRAWILFGAAVRWHRTVCGACVGRCVREKNESNNNERAYLNGNKSRPLRTRVAFATFLARAELFRCKRCMLNTSAQRNTGQNSVKSWKFRVRLLASNERIFFPLLPRTPHNACYTVFLKRE